MHESNWIEDEFSNINLGDKRLNRRFISVAGKLSKYPGFSVNKACQGWKEVKSAYRLFDNDKVSPAKILEPHFQQTMMRAKEYPFILAIQDTSSINFNTHESKKDIGYVGYNDSKEGNSKGFFIHPTMAVSPEGLPLGILNNFFGNRKNLSDKSNPERDKESARWIESVEQVNENTEGKLKMLNVADREADLNDLFYCHKDIGQHFLIRSSKNRRIADSDKKLHEYIRGMPIVSTFETDIQNKKGRGKRKVKMQGRFTDKHGKTSRKAELNIQYTQVNLILNSREYGNTDFPVTVIRVFESERELEEGEKRVDWILITSAEVTSVEMAKLMVDFYGIRWRIEEYFKVLKSGCKIEDSRYENYSRTVRFIALNMVIAWRIFYMKNLNDKVPDAPCTSFLSEIEWKALYCKIKKTKKMPDNIPTVKEAVIWIARLGGYLNRKSDPRPGNQSIWIGFKRLHDMTAILEVMGPPQ